MSQHEGQTLKQKIPAQTQELPGLQKSMEPEPQREPTPPAAETPKPSSPPPPARPSAAEVPARPLGQLRQRGAGASR